MIGLRPAKSDYPNACSQVGRSECLPGSQSDEPAMNPAKLLVLNLVKVLVLVLLKFCTPRFFIDNPGG